MQIVNLEPEVFRDMLSGVKTLLHIKNKTGKNYYQKGDNLNYTVRKELHIQTGYNEETKEYKYDSYIRFEKSTQQFLVISSTLNFLRREETLEITKL